MAFEDIAKRMADRRTPTRAERLEAIWTGKKPEAPPLPEPIEPVAPASRGKTLVLAYLLMAAGLLVAMAGTFPLVLTFDSSDTWEKRGFVLVIGLGVAIIVKAARLFTAVDKTAPLPDARLR